MTTDEQIERVNDELPDGFTFRMIEGRAPKIPILYMDNPEDTERGTDILEHIMDEFELHGCALCGQTPKRKDEDRDDK